MWCKVLYIADLFCLHGNIRLRNITISLFFGASKLFFDFFVFSVKISRLYINLFFKIDIIENVSSQGVPLIYLICISVFALIHRLHSYLSASPSALMLLFYYWPSFCHSVFHATYAVFFINNILLIVYTLLKYYSIVCRYWNQCHCKIAGREAKCHQLLK